MPDRNPTTVSLPCSSTCPQKIGRKKAFILSLSFFLSVEGSLLHAPVFHTLMSPYPNCSTHQQTLAGSNVCLSHLLVCLLYVAGIILRVFTHRSNILHYKCLGCSVVMSFYFSRTFPPARIFPPFPAL